MPTRRDEVIREAIRVAMSGTPGPTYVEYPSHVILEELDVPPVLPPHRYRLTNQGADGDRIAEAAELILAAKNPILLVGHAVYTSQSGAKVRELAELMNCPVIQTSGGTSYIKGHRGPHLPVRVLRRLDRSGRGVRPRASRSAPNSASRSISGAGATGTPARRTASGSTSSRTRPRSASTARSTCRWSAICARSSRSSAARWARGARPANSSPNSCATGRPNSIHLALEVLDKSDGTGNTQVHTSRFIVEATRAFPEGGIMIRDGGASVIFGWTYNQCKPNDVIWNQNYGHIGTGLPYATGAMLADIAETGVTRPGMLVTSDSSFLFHIAELEVAVRRNLPLVCVVAVDFQWGLEVGVYKRTFGQGTAETGTHWSDKVRFDKIAEGLGAYGEYRARPQTRSARLSPGPMRAAVRR